MTTPLMIWCLVVGIFFAILLITAIPTAIHNSRQHTRRRQHTHLIGFITEREEFFVPGDPRGKELDDDDD